MVKISLRGSREFHCAGFTVRFEKAACPVLWHLPTASILAGDFFRPAVGLCLLV